MDLFKEASETPENKFENAPEEKLDPETMQMYDEIMGEAVEKCDAVEDGTPVEAADATEVTEYDPNHVEELDPVTLEEFEELQDGGDIIERDGDYIQSYEIHLPKDGNGYWTGERGNSVWRPNLNDTPSDKGPHSNPDHLKWWQICLKYRITGIEFKDGEPDFSKISKGTVEIDNFTKQRDGKGGNFDQACEKLAEQRGCTKEEVKAWMKENNYTWHECSDCKTMQKVPSEVHSNVPHTGGIAAKKAEERENGESDNKNDAEV